jgi:glycosyltransferase involved in cell wall biosynthesis
VNDLSENSKPSIIAFPPTDRFGPPISEGEIIERAKRPQLRILFLGNVIYRKGLHTLLEAVKDLKPNVCVDVVGSLISEPAYTSLIQELIAKHDLSSFIFLHGSLDRGPLIEKLRQAHILVVPSSYEGFGIVYLEGMGFGLPAIGTSVGAAGEIISEGVEGLLIEPGDAGELANRLRILNGEREVLIRMSLAARERFLRQPKWEETARQIREFLLKRIEDFSV